MSNPTQANPGLGPIFPLYDDAGHQTNVAARAKNVSTDADGVTVGDLGVDVEVTVAPTANQRVNAQSGDFVAGSIADLATLAAAISAGRLLNTPPANQSVNIAQILGSAISYSNPQIAQDQIRAATSSGKHFHGTTGLLTSAASGFNGAQLFNPSGSGVNLYVYSAMVIFNSANFHQFYMTTQTAVGNVTGWTDLAASKVNMDGGNANTSGATCSYSSAAISSTIGTAFESVGTQNNVPVEAFTNGEMIRLTPGNGLLFVLKTGAAASWSITWGWLEY